MKRVALFIISVFFIWYWFAYNILKIEKAVEDKLVQIENIYKQKYQNSYCSKIEGYYNNLQKKIIYLKKKYPRYSDILNAIYNVAVKRKLINLKKCEYKPAKQNIPLPKNQNIDKKPSINRTLKKWDFYLHNAITSYNLSLLWQTYPIKFTAKTDKQVDLSNFELIQDKYDKFYFKIKNKWYLLNWYVLYGYTTNNYSLAKQQVENDAKSKWYDVVLVRKLSPNKYEFYVTKKSKVRLLWNFDPKKGDEYNLRIYDNNWGLVINKLLYSYSSNSESIPLAGIFQHNDRLYYFVTNKKTVSFILPYGNNFYLALSRFKQPIIIVSNWKKYITEFSNFNYYDLWPVEFYKKSNLLENIDKFGKILYETFYNIAHWNYSYSLADLRLLFKFSDKFDWKRLSDAYMRILKNMKYNKKISDLVNSKWFTQQQLIEYLKQHPKYNNYWNDFYALKHKEGVCQTLSDILSLIALINWLNAGTVDWITKRGYAHQISEINWYYYDPTFDLPTKRMEHFWMTRSDLKKYFIINARPEEK